MRKSFCSEHVDGDHGVTTRSPVAGTGRELTEVELDRIAAAGGDPTLGTGPGGKVRSAAEWPPPPRLY